MLQTHRQAHDVAPALGATLIRLHAEGPEWIDRLPPVPVGEVVTVTVSDAALRQVPPQRLLETGYRVVGMHPPTADGPTVDLLVSAEMAAGHVGFLRQLVGCADRAFDLRMGPVQLALGPELAIHLGLA